MKIRLGYAVISKTLEGQKLFHTLTYTNYLKKEDSNNYLTSIINQNLEGLMEILKYNVKNNIHFYRLNSSLIPLATHSEVDYDYKEKVSATLDDIGKYIGKNNLRVDTHPDQFCVLNSTKEEVVTASIKILEYESFILKQLKISNPIIILHVGSMEGGKEESIQRFKDNFKKLDKDVQNMIALENDDRVYKVKDVLTLCEDLHIPMVLDYHHYLCNNNGDNLDDYLSRIFATWQNNLPKVHFSSPKSKLKKEYRSHHDYINVLDFINFMRFMKKYDQDFDIMIEAKMKDEALFRLVRELKYLTNYTFLDETTFIV